MEINVPTNAYFVYENLNTGKEMRLCFVCAVQMASNIEEYEQIFTKLHDKEEYELFECEECGKDIV